MTSVTYSSILARIGTAIRGIADPLLASYCRTYLVVCAQKVIIDITAIFIFMEVIYIYISR